MNVHLITDESLENYTNISCFDQELNIYICVLYKYTPLRCDQRVETDAFERPFRYCKRRAGVVKRLKMGATLISLTIHERNPSY